MQGPLTFGRFLRLKRRQMLAAAAAAAWLLPLHLLLAVPFATPPVPLLPPCEEKKGGSRLIVDGNQQRWLLFPCGAELCREKRNCQVFSFKNKNYLWLSETKKSSENGIGG
jgi:hypothetical protein